MSGLFSGLLRLTARSLQSACNFRQFHAFPSSAAVNPIAPPAITNVWSSVPTRTTIRENFPKPSEYKRLKKHGWRVKLQTKNGRRQIMRRILKGRFYLTH